MYIIHVCMYLQNKYVCYNIGWVIPIEQALLSSGLDGAVLRCPKILMK